MSTSHYALRRVAFAVLALYLVLTLTFAFVVFTPDQYFLAKRANFALAHQDLTVNSTEFQQLQRSYIEARGRDKPLVDRYLGWVAGISTLQWGYSVSQDRVVTAALVDGVGRSALYVVPGVVLAVVLGVAGGLYSAIRRGSLTDRFGRAAVYLLFGLPGFWLASVVLAVGPGEAIASSATWKFGTAAAVLAVGLLAGQVSFARAHSLEYVSARFVTVLRAKGLANRSVTVRVLRNVAVPVVSLVFTELLAVLLLNVFVLETVFHIEGFGRLVLDAVEFNDIPLILGTTMVVALVGVGGSLVQDLLYGYLDPRIDLFR